MLCHLNVQYAHFQPDEAQSIGPADLHQALEVLKTFPWETEFDIISERTAKNLTSGIPNIALRRPDNEVLIIAARDLGSFIIEYRDSTHQASLIVPHNSYENTTGLTVERIVADFYSGSLRKKLHLKRHATAAPDDQHRFKVSDFPLFAIGLTTGILILILLLSFWHNGFTEKSLMAVYFVGAIALAGALPFTLSMQYLRYDWGKELVFGADGTLSITQSGRSIVLRRADLACVTVVENPSDRFLRDYKYSQIMTRAGEIIVVTSFVIDPMRLVNKLHVHHREHNVLLPFVKERDKGNENVRRQKYYEEQKKEFLKAFAGHSDSKLRSIIGDRSYADYAVDAARDILDSRTELSRK